MKYLAVLLLALVACKSASEAPAVMGVELFDSVGNVSGFVRSDTVIFVGQGQVGMSAFMFWKATGTDIVPPKGFSAGDLVVMNRETGERLTLKPGDTVPAYVLEVMRGMTPAERLADAARLGLVVTPRP